MRLAEWLSRWPGSLLLDVERAEFDRLLPDLFGFHLLQVGAIPGRDLSASSRIRHRVVLDCGGEAGTGLPGSGVAACDAEYLPIANDTIDVLLLPHLLEFTPDPQGCLRECERVLVNGGHLLLTGFSPWSLAGLGRMPLALWRRPPWNGRFLSLARLCEWLELLGFEVVEARCLFFRPNGFDVAGNRWSRLVEGLGRRLMPAIGCNYILLARKSAGAVIPLQGRTRRRPPLLPVAQPSPGSSRSGWQAPVESRDAGTG